MTFIKNYYKSILAALFYGITSALGIQLLLVWYRTVNDTGTFAYDNPYQIDMAMPNSMIPSYGITSATVEILS